MDQASDKGVFTVGIGGAAGDGVKKAGINIGLFLQKLGYEIYVSFDYPSLIRGGHNFARISFGKEKIWNDHPKLDILVAFNEETIDIHKDELKEGAAILTNLSSSQITENPEIVFGKNKLESGQSIGELIDGNRALSRGLLAAGLDFYFAYPMTPSTSILHYLAGRQTTGGLKVIQPENELSVINMALGAIYAGKRTAVGSAAGGFALMQEAFSFAGMAELPLVVAVSQRQAPATGVPTYSSQSDLRFVLHAGHGEFPRIVLAPGDPEESFYIGATALNLAWQFQMPIIVLLDKILSEHMMTSRFDENSISINKGKLAENVENNYNRYQITEDGISPLVFPGTASAIVKVNSYEHDENGVATEELEKIKKMLDKRFTKAETVKSIMGDKETIKIYGDPDSKNIIVFFGSVKGAILEAAKFFNKSIKLLQIVWLEPFDQARVAEELGGAKKIIVVEANHDGQLASLIREKTGIEINEKILKYDSRPFNPMELAEIVNKKIE